MNELEGEIRHCVYLLATKQMKFRFIDDHRPEFPVSRMRKVLENSRSGYYTCRSRASVYTVALISHSPKGGNRAVLLHRSLLQSASASRGLGVCQSGVLRGELSSGG